jgi:Aldehyde:ferredoxin oxidoreductase
MPDRIFEEKLEIDEAKLSKEEFEKMMDEYYEIRRWDEDGVPKKEKLKELNLEGYL